MLRVMNPRHRRLLFPGLLIALLIVVVVSALANKAEAADNDGKISQFTDPRITESSGLVVGRDDDDLAYTVNDSGNASMVFAVQLSSGKTVGTATAGVNFVDAEALSVDSASTLWIADTGDNNRMRNDVALYALPEFGATQVQALAKRYPLVYPEGPRDVEALVINPRNDQKFLLTKGLMGGEVFEVPEELKQGEPNRVTLVDAVVPAMITDAAFTPDGRYVVARNYIKANVLDAATWKTVDSVRLPLAQQGETLAMEPSGTSFLVGSEGAGAAINQVALTAPVVDEPTSTAQPAASGQTPSAAEPGNSGFAGSTWMWTGLAMALLAAVCVGATRRG